MYVIIKVSILLEYNTGLSVSYIEKNLPKRNPVPVAPVHEFENVGFRKRERHTGKHVDKNVLRSRFTSFLDIENRQLHRN